ncbi:MAG: glycoside hydrolase family 2 TIM barrel-domain containing protein, partial [Tepidisphaeraceae bacterium]
MTRRRICLNREWKFLHDDVSGAEVPGFDDASWQPIGLPHTFDLPYFRTPEFDVGYGWYRTRFEVSGSGCKCFLEFDGVFQVAEVFVNGQRVGAHAGGYTGFSINITDAVRGGENVLAVRVNNLWNAQLQPRAGEHVFCGGIYRDVHLVVTDPLHVTWNGLSVTTPRVSAEFTTVNVRTEVRNDTDRPQICNLRSQISDPAGQIVGVVKSRHSLAPHSTVEFDQTAAPIAQPKLWHPDHPHLYSIRTQVYADDRLVDEIEIPFGVRWFDWTADRGFFLNGEHLYLRGVNAHQDHAGWGIAITRAACERDVQLIKEAGFNFVRGAHYPHHPAFADACDRLGLIFWSENA